MILKNTYELSKSDDERPILLTTRWWNTQSDTWKKNSILPVLLATSVLTLSRRHPQSWTGLQAHAPSTGTCKLHGDKIKTDLQSCSQLQLNMYRRTLTTILWWTSIASQYITNLSQHNRYGISCEKSISNRHELCCHSGRTTRVVGVSHLVYLCQNCMMMDPYCLTIHEQP